MHVRRNAEKCRAKGNGGRGGVGQEAVRLLHRRRYATAHIECSSTVLSEAKGRYNLLSGGMVAVVR